MRSLMVFVTTLTATLLLSGCGGEPVIPLAPVTGTVTEDGKPVAGAIVEFLPTGGRTSVGQTNAEGVFTMKYGDEEGVVIGACKVQITPGVLDAEGEGGSDMVAPPMQAPPELVAVPDGVTVVDGPNSFDFELSDYRKAKKKKK